MAKRPKKAQAKSGCSRGLTQKLLKKAPALKRGGVARSTRGSGLSSTNARQASAIGTANSAYASVSVEAVDPASTQKKVMVHSVCICEEIINEVPPISEPATIHGVRRPKRVRVRSES